MAAALRPYRAYKDSGVEWLGKVPAHWAVQRLKSWVDVNEFVLSEDTDPQYMFEYLDIGSVATGRLTAKPERIRFGNSPSRARRVVRPGDTIVSTVRTYLKAVWHAEHPGDDLIASTGFAVLTPRRGTFPRFVNYFCQSDPFTNRVTAEAVGIAYPAIAETRLGTFDVCIPPYPEQAAIVRFLDHADRRIRRYIRAKQKLIALLEEQKQAVIYQAVTGQTDVRSGRPYRAYKASGLEWLREIPENWDIRRTRALFKLRTEKSGVAHGRELLSVYAHIGVRPRKELEQRGNKASTTDDYWIVRSGDLVVNKLLTWMGAIGVSHYEGVTSPAYDILMPTMDLVSDYYHHLFRTPTYLQQFRQHSRGIMDMRLRLYFEQLGQIPVPVPPVDEQRAIVNFYAQVTVDLNQVIKDTRRELDLLREYHTRLIADAVTGKVDVREAAARLPDEGEELEPLDEPDALIDGEEEPTDALATAH